EPERDREREQQIDQQRRQRHHHDHHRRDQRERHEDLAGGHGGGGGRTGDDGGGGGGHRLAHLRGPPPAHRIDVGEDLRDRPVERRGDLGPHLDRAEERARERPPL